ncbi:MAG: tetratricopeptide repeat protein [Deltaproteobacteria bacterium]|nr:tetratricopeptide repeat protein [Deltaproteobacteria bacterium]
MRLIVKGSVGLWPAALLLLLLPLGCQWHRPQDSSGPDVFPSDLTQATSEQALLAMWSFCPWRLGSACPAFTSNAAVPQADARWKALAIECRALQIMIARNLRRENPPFDLDGLTRQARTVLDENPRSLESKRALALALMLNDRVTEAAGLLQSALNDDRNNPYTLLTQAVLVRKDPVQAEALLRRAEAQAPNLPALWLVRAWQAEERNDPELAERAYRRALTHDPRNTAVMIGLGRLEMDNVDTQAIAAERFAQVLALNPGDEVAMFNLALIRLREGHPDQTRGHVQRLLELHPKDPMAWELQGLAQRATGAYLDAAHSFRMAISLDPALAGPFFNLGVLCAVHLMDISCARDSFSSFLNLEPQGARADQVRAWLLDHQDPKPLESPVHLPLSPLPTADSSQ